MGGGEWEQPQLNVSDSINCYTFFLKQIWHNLQLTIAKLQRI